MNFNSKTQQHVDISFGTLTGILIGLLLMTIIFGNDVEVFPLLVLAFICAGFYIFFKNKNNKSNGIIDLYKVSRVEVIDDKGRSYVKYCNENEVQASMQDKGMTLKIFINKKHENHT